MAPLTDVGHLGGHSEKLHGRLISHEGIGGGCNGRNETEPHSLRRGCSQVQVVKTNTVLEIDTLK